MFRIESYMADLTAQLQKALGERLLYVGLQGSYLRGEATPESDIDVMTVVEGLSVNDLASYRSVVRRLGHSERACGFICSREDLLHWNPMELCQLLHTTKDCFGCLQDLLPSFTPEDERNYVKLSLNNLYHALCHRYIHASREANIVSLPMAGKAAFFILQNLYYLQTGQFVLTQKELATKLTGEDKRVMDLVLQLKSGEPFDFEPCFALLFHWCQHALQRV